MDPDQQAALLMGQIDGWLERTISKPAEVQPGSDLDADDHATDYLHVSHMVVTSLLHAVDHLHCLKTLLVDAQVLHTSAPFTLIRSAVENASVAVWLLAPEDPQERRLRRLRLALADAKDSVEIQELVGQRKRSLEARQADIFGIAARSGITKDQLGTRQPGFETIVTAASKHVGDGDLHRIVWKGCSGLAHGRQWATVALLQAEDQGRDGDVLTRQLTAGLPFVINAASSAGVMTKRAFDLLDHRRRRWYGQRRPLFWVQDQGR